MTAQTIVEGLINNATAQANTAATSAQTFASAAQTAAIQIISLTPPPNPTQPNVVVPLFDPQVDLTGDFLKAYNDAIADYDPDFATEVTDFINRFFPNNIGCLKTSIDGWLCDTVTLGGTGMPVGVVNAIWQRDREREIMDASRAEDEVLTGYSGRGWNLPSGVLVDGVQRVQRALTDKISASSRDRAIDEAKIEIENIRFAVEQGIKLRLGVIDALVNFLRAWAQMKELAIEKAKALVDAKTRLYNSVGAYYSAIIGAAQLVLEYDKLRIDSHIKQQEITVRASSENLRSRVEAAVSAANAMGSIASSALSSQNSIAELSHNTSASET